MVCACLLLFIHGRIAAQGYTLPTQTSPHLAHAELPVGACCIPANVPVSEHTRGLVARAHRAIFGVLVDAVGVARVVEVQHLVLNLPRTYGRRAHIHTQLRTQHTTS